MPIQYKIDVLSALKQAGYTSYKLRNEKIMSESTIQKLRNNELVAIPNIETLCRLLSCQPGDLLEYQPQEQPDTLPELDPLADLDE